MLHARCPLLLQVLAALGAGKLSTCSTQLMAVVSHSKWLLCVQTNGPFAAVVIATPLELSGIEFEGLQLPHIPPRKFQSTISTFVRGCLNATYFGVKQPPRGVEHHGCGARTSACLGSQPYLHAWMLQMLTARGVCMFMLHSWYSSLHKDISVAGAVQPVHRRHSLYTMWACTTCLRSDGACESAGAIMISEHAGTPFSVISPARAYADKTHLFKLFSTDPLQAEALNDIFTQHTVIASFPWYAYPEFHPPEQYTPFRLADGLFYSNAMENAASCMEISAVAAMNSALLVQKYLNKTHITTPQGTLAAHNVASEL